ncbi:MAG: hypothetical protein SNJ72_06330, partial [Fimbriimonadales bacterium]
MQWILRTLVWRLWQSVLILLPVGLILLAGLYYLIQVKLAVEANLPTALRTYTRQQSDLDLHIARLSLGLTRLRLWEVQLNLPDGSLLLATRYAELRYPRRNEPLTLILERPHARIARNAQGVWNLEPLFRRPPPDEPTQLPFVLVATDGTLEFEDAVPSPSVRQTIQVHRLHLAQPLQALYAQAVASAPDLGTIQAEALSDGRDWLIDLRADRVNADRLVGYLRLPDLRAEN